MNAPPPEKILRKLFLTLFLRGRSSRGLRKSSAPKSVGAKLALVLIVYTLMGLLAFAFRAQPVFGLALYLHGMTFVFLGMFVASSAGEILFNKEEADILMHRPVLPKTLLWAKIGVLVEVSLWVAGAFNLVGLFVGVCVRDGDWRFPLVHAFSTVLEALFCTGAVVVVYQLCLRWCGRERLDALMTTAQVIMSVGAVLAGQIVPRLMFMMDGSALLSPKSWWVCLLPPAWFAGLDDLLAGSAGEASPLFAALACTATAGVLWLAFGKLARDYASGLQNLNEARATRPRRPGHRRWIETLVQLPPLRWWLRDSVARAAFLLTGAYLVRDRDVKLRIYPGLAPMLIMPFIMLLQGRGIKNPGHTMGNFGVAFSGAFLGIVPMLALGMLKYSQQWQAADVFRAVPLAGPAALCHGARRAVLVFLALPVALMFVLVSWLLSGSAAELPLLIPGLLATPVYALLPCLGGDAVPFAQPTEEAKAAGRSLSMFGAMMFSFVLAGLSLWAWASGWFVPFLAMETVIVAFVYYAVRRAVESAPWPSME